MLCYNGTLSFWSRRSVNTPSAGICCALLSWESSRSWRRDRGRGSGVLVLCFLPTGKWQPLSCCRKQNAHSSLITHLETTSHPFLHGGLVPAFPLRCFPGKATLMLLNQNWAMGAEDFRRKKPFAFCPAVLTGRCCIKLQVQSYAHQGGNLSWRKSITRKGIKTAGKAFTFFAFPVLNPIWIRKIAAV